MQDYGLTASRLATFNACKRKHYFMYELGVRKEPSRSLALGSAVHEGLDALKKGGTPDEAARATMESFGPITPDDADKMLDMVQAVCLVRRWHDRWGGEPLEVVASELKFDMPMPKANGRQTYRWRLRGKLDGIVRLPDTRLAILEHKTAAQMGEAYWQRLELDEQVTIYVIAARAMGYPVETVLYDVIRKPSIKPWKDESLENYSLRLNEDIGSRPEFYFVRREIARLDDTLHEGLLALNQVARDINHARKQGHWYRNSNSCRSPYPCPYLGVCSSNTNLEETIPVGFYKAETMHPELEETNGNGTTAGGATKG